MFHSIKILKPETLKPRNKIGVICIYGLKSL